MYETKKIRRRMKVNNNNHNNNNFKLIDRLIYNYYNGIHKYY